MFNKKMKDNYNQNNEQIFMKIFNQYKIKLITNLDTINISIQNGSNIYKSYFNYEHLHKLFIEKNTIKEITEFICILIEHNNIQIEENGINLKLILILNIINNDNIELILSKELQLSILKISKSIKVHNNCVYSISIFPCGNIILVSQDKSIKIFDINYNILQHIKNVHDDCIINVEIKDDNNFVSYSYKSIKKWVKNKNKFIKKEYINNAHESHITKVIYYLNNYLISCSWDKTVKIWEKQNKNYELITTLNHSNWVTSILLIQEFNILISSGLNGTKLWNINNFELIKYFKEVECFINNGLDKIDNNNIIVGGHTFKIISILEKKIIKEIQIPIRSSLKVIEEKRIIFIGGINNDIMIYNSDNYECIQIIKHAHNDYIYGFLKLNDGSIASFSFDGIIKIWSF